MNWREPLPAAALAQQKRMASQDYLKTPQFKTRAFAMKKPVVAKNYFGPWEPFTDYKPGLKCELCTTTIRRAINPQRLYWCGHVFCEECIHQYCNIKRNTNCPTCKKECDSDNDPYYDHEDYDERDDGCPGCGQNCCDGRCDEDNGCPHCGPGCDGDCGILSCGCVDVCRGRCDPDGYRWY